MADESLDRERIRDVIARYNVAGDRRDMDAFIGTFCDDAVWESAVFRCIGRSAIRDYLSRAWRPAPEVPAPRFRRHHLTTAQIDLTSARTAVGRIYYLMITDLGLDHCGFYVDCYRRDGGQWLIAHREVWMDWADPASLYVPEISKRMVVETGTCGPPPRM
jgi:ketosteroid isomerase-like protein